jgi:hypothetical protein
MSTFSTRVETPPSAAPDPTKHVNYNVGMVLGIDDFNQEFAYLSGRDQWIARDLIGYGTVSGLRVLTESDVKGPRVVVEPGVALSPRGQLIRVPVAQCAYLNDWLKLDSIRGQITAHLESPPAPLRVYVVLCYRECPADNVPIPGEPCRTEDDSMAPSRLVDDFRLELTFNPPGQREEDAIRRFVKWLSQIEVSDLAVSTPLSDILDAIRGAAHLLSSPPEPGSDPLLDFMTGSPPASFVMNTADVCEYLDAIFRLWVTELRPKCRPDFLAEAHGCSGRPAGSIGEIEECLLLAEVDVPVIVPGGGSDWQVEDPNLIDVDEQRRPIVVHLRMLQEMLLCGRAEQLLASPPLSGGGGGPVNLSGDVTGPSAATSVVRIRGVAVDPTAPTQNQVLTFRQGQWRPFAAQTVNPANTVVAEQAFGLTNAAGTAAGFSRADHTHGTPPDPIPTHSADPAAHNVAGDVTGTIGVTRVARIQGVAVDATPPAQDQVLTFRGGQWRPTALPPGSAQVNPSNTVPSQVAFGLPSSAGTSAAYSRGDHTHGTPPDPIPAHRSDANAHTLAGDVSGNVGATTVAGIRNAPVVGTPADGQVLTFRSNQWQAETPQAGAADVVEHPPGLGRYFIVAAGIVRCDGTSRPPVYNQLVARTSNASQVTVRFNGDRPPTAAFQYVVKVLPVFADGFDAIAVSFIQFLQGGGFQLRITRAGQQIPREELGRLELIIEVSRFE